MSLYAEGHFDFVNHPEAKSKWSLEARIKAAVIEPLLNLKPIPPDLYIEAGKKAAQFLMVAWNYRNPGKERRQKQKVTRQTIDNWVHAYTKGDRLNSLERRPRQGGSTLHADVYTYVRDLLITTDWPLTKVQSEAEGYARDKLSLPEEEWPTIDEVRYVDKELCDAVQLYGKEGREAYRARAEMAGRFEATYPNELWQGDHHLLDISVLNPETGEYERPWIALILHDYTRCVRGFHLSFRKGSDTIGMALRHAMLTKQQPNWIAKGIPQTYYVDNGKEYCSDHITSVCRHFRITLKHHEPYHPRSKGKVERFFRTLEEMCIRYLPGYLGSNPNKRPKEVNPSLDIDQLREKIIDFIVNIYHMRIHRSLKATPQQRWLESNHVIRPVQCEEDLDHLLESTTRKVQEGKGVQFDNEFYTDDKGLLMAHAGESVSIFYDRNDISTVRVWYRDHDREKFLCIAVRNRSAEELAEISRRVRKGVSQEVQASTSRLRKAGHKSSKNGATSTGSGTATLGGSNEQSSAATEPAPAPLSPAQPRRKIVRYLHELEEDQ